jgi:hypothetical protein
MTHLARFVVPVLVAALWGGCAAAGSDIRVETLHDPKTDLAGYHSYAWVGALEVLKDETGEWSPVGFDLSSEVRLLIDEQLRERGLVFGGEQPDLLVGYVLVVDTGAQLDELKKRYGDDLVLDNRHEGGLLVGLVDAETGKAVWVGAATAQLKKKRTDDEARERLHIAIDKLFDELPR